MQVSEIKKYLLRIGLPDFNGATNADNLRLLHKRHLFNIPFENLDIHLNNKIILNTNSLFDKIIHKKRGGFCYELNGLFYDFLISIGYKAKMISAGVYNDEGYSGQDFDHMAIIVNLDEKNFLCDVGFGDSFIEPLEFSPGREQEDHGSIFKIIETNHDNYILQRRDDENGFRNLYIFSLKQRLPDDFEQMCIYHQTSTDSTFTKKRVCTLAFPNGRYTLRDNKFIVTNYNKKKEIIFEGEDQFEKYLTQYFGIHLK